MDFDDLDLSALRRRRSVKWRTYPPDVLPAWVAEMDLPLAAPVRDALLAAVARDDMGYAHPGELPEAFAEWAGQRMGWAVDPKLVRVAPDVMAALVEALRVLTAPGDGVVLTPPVYNAFWPAIPEMDRRIVEVPLDADGVLDLGGLERAFATGAARAMVLCNPHNPTGRVLGREQLVALAALAARHDVWVLADEIHAPMVLGDARHVPFLTLGEDAVAVGVALTSASKAWNLAGMKCALLVTGSAATHERLAGLPRELPYRASLPGVLASIAAFRDGGAWLDALRAHLDRNRRLLAELLAAQLPEIRYRPPDASYLAWLDCRALDLGPDPAATFLERGRVALSSGPNFGPGGEGHARLDMGTSAPLMEEAVARMAIALDRPGP
jgi:cystathionine beta-lyase